MAKSTTSSKTTKAQKSAKKVQPKTSTTKKTEPKKSAKSQTKSTKEKSKTATKKASTKDSTKSKVATKINSKKTSSVKASTKSSRTKKTASAKVSAKERSTKTTKEVKQKASAKTAKTKPVKFRINQKIVYPTQGVGKILGIEEITVRGEKRTYYNIAVESTDMILKVPVENAVSSGIRQIVSAPEAEKALKMLSQEFEPVTSDWKLRYQMNLDLLKKGSIQDIATIVQCLYNRSKVKELPIQERKLYDSAKKLLEDEISLALGKSPKEIENLIHSKLEQTSAIQKVKHITPLDDDDDDNIMDDMSDSGSSDDDAFYDDDD
ncbi:MAG: hypothetical protein IKI31_00820 [Treponema sp.]|nr:hypothetical protein [Treponema sp.]